MKMRWIHCMIDFHSKSLGNVCLFNLFLWTSISDWQILCFYVWVHWHQCRYVLTCLPFSNSRCILHSYKCHLFHFAVCAFEFYHSMGLQQIEYLWMSTNLYEWLSPLRSHYSLDADAAAHFDFRLLFYSPFTIDHVTIRANNTYNL